LDVEAFPEPGHVPGLIGGANGVKAAPLRGAAGAPATGPCVGTRARHGRADAGQQPQISPLIE